MLGISKTFKGRCYSDVLKYIMRLSKTPLTPKSSLIQKERNLVTVKSMRNNRRVFSGFDHSIRSVNFHLDNTKCYDCNTIEKKSDLLCFSFAGPNLIQPRCLIRSMKVITYPLVSPIISRHYFLPCFQVSPHIFYRQQWPPYRMC